MKNKTKHYYHFTSDKLRDGSPLPKVGEWLVHEGDLVPCKSGLHASAHPFDALQYAPGSMLHMVELGGVIVPHGKDKVVAIRRKIVKSIDATELLRDFSRRVALDVLPLWKNAPQVVVDYLKTGDESKRWAAREAAWAALAAEGAATTKNRRWLK